MFHVSSTNGRYVEHKRRNTPVSPGRPSRNNGHPLPPQKVNIVPQRRAQARGTPPERKKHSCSGQQPLRTFNTAQPPAPGNATLATGQPRSSQTGPHSKEATGSGSAAKVKRSQAGASTTGPTTEISSGSFRTTHQNEKCTTAGTGMKFGDPREGLVEKPQAHQWKEPAVRAMQPTPSSCRTI